MNTDHTDIHRVDDALPGARMHAPGDHGPDEMRAGQAEIRVKGKLITVPSARVDGRTVIVTGKWVKQATLLDEEQLEGERVPDPESFIARLKRSGLKADLFTFGQKLPDTVPRFKYHLEWDSLAVIPITSYLDWWQRLAKYDCRNAVKKAARLGVVTKRVTFDDDLVKGIMRIYDESPVRQGKPFWHYKKGFTTVRQMSSTYLDRSIFIGAYYHDELIGFIKMVTVDRSAYTFHVISMMRHFDKKPTNALLAKAVETCSDMGLLYLVYGNFIYGDSQNSLTEFKRRNGFQEVLLPRYYVPLTKYGEIALKASLHHGMRAMLPKPLRTLLLSGRAALAELRAPQIN